MSRRWIPLALLAVLATACNSWSMAGQGASRRGWSRVRHRRHAGERRDPHRQLGRECRRHGRTARVVRRDPDDRPAGARSRSGHRRDQVVPHRHDRGDPRRRVFLASNGTTCTLRRVAVATGVTDTSATSAGRRSSRRRARRAPRSPARSSTATAWWSCPGTTPRPRRHRAARRPGVSARGPPRSTARSRRSRRQGRELRLRHRARRPAHPTEVRERHTHDRTLRHDLRQRRRRVAGHVCRCVRPVVDRAGDPPDRPGDQRHEDVARRHRRRRHRAGVRRGDRRRAVGRIGRCIGGRAARGDQRGIFAIGGSTLYALRAGGCSAALCAPSWSAPIGHTATTRRRSRATCSTSAPARASWRSMPAAAAPPRARR